MCPWQLDYQPQGLKNVGIPYVMGESLKSHVSAVAELLVHVLARVRRTKPSCILALRVTLLYAVSSVDFCLTLMPLSVCAASWLRCTHRFSKWPAAPYTSSWFPAKYLLVPLHLGGLGYPCVELHLRLQRILLTLKAACSCSVYTKELVRVCRIIQFGKTF